MENRTKVNIKHLLEDLRDAYPLGSTEEIVLTELAANALDAGARTIRFDFDRARGCFSVADDGRGMSRVEFESYHDIAESSKARGRGIGFAGVGAKLALLISRAVYTETAGPDGRFAAVWRLVGDRDAVWREVLPAGKVERGTYVELFLGRDSQLLEPAFVRRKLEEHFLPLIVPAFEAVWGEVYGGRVRLLVRGSELVLPRSHPFREGIFRRVGEGGVLVSRYGRSEPVFLLSARGKVVMRGWEAVGIAVDGFKGVWGIAELPGLVQVLSLNKCEVLKDPASLRVWRKLRKAAARVLEELLRELGVFRKEDQGDGRLSAQLSEVFSRLLRRHPELRAIFSRAVPCSCGEDRRKGATGGGFAGRLLRSGVGASASLQVEFGQLEQHVLSALIDRRVILNEAHPAFRKVRQVRGDELLAVVALACALSRLVEKPYEVIEEALNLWAVRS
ncbi:MAG: ATP-binding protein [Thermofilaceae archaeon]